MGLVSHSKKFIYIKTVKTAGTTVQNYFLPYCVPETVQLNDLKTNFEMVSDAGIVGKIIQPKCRNFYFHQSAKEMRKLLGKEIWNDYFKFCCIRNPYDQLVSHYHFGMDRGQFPKDTTFDHYVRKIKPKFSAHHRSNWNLYSVRRKPAMDFYIRYEHLQEDIAKLCNQLNIPFDDSKIGKNLSHIRPDNDHYQSYYDESLKRFVYKKWGKIIDAFGYNF